MMRERILAKSSHGGREVTLPEHSQSVLDATGAMFGQDGRPTRLARQWLRFFGVPTERFDAFLRTLQVAGAFHDLGKANDGFQRAVRNKGPQVIRHEHLSGLLLRLEPLRAWLDAARERGVDPDVALSAVVAHHLKVDSETFARPLVPSESPAVRVYAGSPEVQDVLAMGAASLSTQPPDVDAPMGAWGFTETIYPLRESFRRHMYGFGRQLMRDDARLRLLLAVKAAVVAVDSAGSAITREGLDRESWLGGSLGLPALRGDDVERLVIEPRIRELEARGRWHGYHDFQLAAGALGPRALLLAGCGTGKTLAAWRWIAAQVERREVSRILFLYPTRATATEGFRDYVSWGGPADASLLHGTAPFDLVDMFTNPGDPRSGGDYGVRDRMFSLAYWDRRLFSATVDSFLAFMANRYAALCMLPLLADSVVVVDEVHSFDKSMFNALERFLKFFDVPLLSMTASLPVDRLRTLKEGCGLESFPRFGDQFADLERQAHEPRYRVFGTSEAEAGAWARRALEAGRRVLWVVNTVRRCQRVVQHLSLPDGVSILCYHSRFRLKDRKARHEEVIARFRQLREPLLAVATQVCEMSLDLDADVLITEIASVPALIQRMGRCCREPLPSERGAGRVGEVYAYSPPDSRPYEDREIREGTSFVEHLVGQRALCHADLAAYLDRMEVADPFIEGRFSGFLDSGWYAMGRDDTFREDDEYTVDAVLDEDVAEFVRARARRSPDAEGLVVPVPHRLARADAALGRYLCIAPADHYHLRLGFVAG